jgi:hypothetical protein
MKTTSAYLKINTGLLMSLNPLLLQKKTIRRLKPRKERYNNNAIVNTKPQLYEKSFFWLATAPFFGAQQVTWTPEQIKDIPLNGRRAFSTEDQRCQTNCKRLKKRLEEGYIQKQRISKSIEGD